VRFRPINIGSRIQCLDSDHSDKAGEQDITDTNENGEGPADQQRSPKSRRLPNCRW
jgi:hypothetical protein